MDEIMTSLFISNNVYFKKAIKTILKDSQKVKTIRNAIFIYLFIYLFTYVFIS